MMHMYTNKKMHGQSKYRHVERHEATRSYCTAILLLTIDASGYEEAKSGAATASTNDVSATGVTAGAITIASTCFLRAREERFEAAFERVRSS